MTTPTSLLRRFVVGSIAIVALWGCGDDDDATVETPAGSESEGAEANACPNDGCAISITDVVSEGDELTVTWDPNFAPDLDRNHIHIFWDLFTAEQVSSDAAERGVEQGEWVPTEDDPAYTTEGAVSTSVRGESTTLCVTAGDGDHAVIDTTKVDCRDVSDLL